MGCQQQIPLRKGDVHHDARGFIVTCMDFRLLSDIANFMDSNGYNKNYDQFILAGASLGMTQTKFPHWGNSLLDHMNIGLNLHHFRQIIFIDHLDCGAYKKFYPEITEGQDQLNFHKLHLQKARDFLSKKFPNFEFKGYLMNLDGSVQKIDTIQNHQYDHEREIQEHEHFLAGIKKAHLSLKL